MNENDPVDMIWHNNIRPQRRVRKMFRHSQPAILDDPSTIVQDNMSILNLTKNTPFVFNAYGYKIPAFCRIIPMRQTRRAGTVFPAKFLIHPPPPSCMAKSLAIKPFAVETQNFASLRTIAPSGCKGLNPKGKSSRIGRRYRCTDYHGPWPRGSGQTRARGK